MEVPLTESDTYHNDLLDPVAAQRRAEELRNEAGIRMMQAATTQPRPRREWNGSFVRDASSTLQPAPGSNITAPAPTPNLDEM